MPYFLKVQDKKNRTYISIVESYYNPDKKCGAHRTYKSLGSVETQIANGIENPISYFQKEVDKLNNEANKKKEDRISNVSPIFNIGYFPFKLIMDKLRIKEYIDLFTFNTNFDFDLFEMLSASVYSRLIDPCSKRKTFHDVIPSLYEKYNFSYDQLLDGINYMGVQYSKFVELFTRQANSVFKLDTSTTYFDCTNFYFEIDREDDLRRKGPSKENRTDPIVGLGLLLDKNLIPINMKIFPGNKNEKPVLPEIIKELKQTGNIKGKTIHVADKGLNCSNNITNSILNGDGYIFSKSIKGLPETEKVWILNDNDWKYVYDKKKSLKYKYKSCIDDYPYYVIDKDGKKQKVNLTEKRIVTYNPELAKKQRIEINKLVEKAKSLNNCKAKRMEYGDASKYVVFESIDKDNTIINDKIDVSLNVVAIEKDLELAGYNMLITSETNMKEQEIYDTYHNLWRIEESFRIMKSDLDARPVFLQKQHSIEGHFFICYIAVLLLRILQFKVLKNKFSSSEIISFVRNFRVVKHKSDLINISTKNDLIDFFEELSKVPIGNSVLYDAQIKKLLHIKK